VKPLRQLAIDEIAIGVGHRYLPLVLDLETGAVVHAGRAKGGAALEAFWKPLRHSGAQVRAVAAAMSAAYIDAVRRRLPKATLVFHRFHVMRLFNDKLSELRRQLYRQATARERRAYGYRDEEFFHLKILACHEAKYALVG
jgi:transposase